MRLIKIIAIVAAVLLIVGFFTTYPYFKMPSESQEMLDAKLVEYQKIAETGRSRPKHDRRILDDVMSQIGKRNLKQEVWLNQCPPITLETLESQKLLIPEVTIYENQLAVIFDDGLVIQNDGHFLSELPNLDAIKNYLDQLLISAAINHAAGEKEQLMNRLANVVELINALERVPNLLLVMTAQSFESQLYEAIVFLLPSLDEEAIKTLKENISKLPDGPEELINALKAETVAIVEIVDHLGHGTDIPGYKKGENLQIDSMLDSFSTIEKWPWYYTRERYTYLSLATRDIEAMEGWIAAGSEGEPPDNVQKQLHSVVALAAMPSTPRLMKKAAQKMKERSVILKAMDAELIRRKSNSKTQVEIPFIGNGKIILKDEYGCILNNLPNESE